MPPPLRTEYPPSVLILYEDDGTVAFAANTGEELQRAAADVLAVRFLAGWYPPRPEGTEVALLRTRIVALITRHAEASPVEAWPLLAEASTVYGHLIELLPLTPVRAYAARLNPADR
jgi:hypothetical protein